MYRLHAVSPNGEHISDVHENYPRWIQQMLEYTFGYVAWIETV